MPPVVAATVAAATAPTTTTNGGESSVVVFNREVFAFRAPFAGVSARDRAARAQLRIQELLERPGVNQVQLVTESLGTLVQIDGATAFLITPADIDVTQGEEMGAVAKRTAAALTTVIAESQESRNMDSMLHALVKATVATVLFFLVVRVASWIRRKVAALFANLVQRHAERVQLGGLRPLQSERVTLLGRMALKGLYGLVVFVAFYNWLSFTLSSFPFTRIWGETLSAYLFDFVTQIGSAVLHAIPGLVTALLIFLVARWFNGVLGSFFERVQSGAVRLDWLDADVVAPTRRIAKSLLWLFALAMAYPYLPGAETEAFKGLSVLAGLMISLGASNLVGQAASGLILTYGRVFRKGEYVRIAESEGTVTEMGMFATRIRTGLGEELTIANSKILESTTRNYSRAVKGVGFVLDTTVTIGYDTPWRQVHAMLSEAALRTEGVLSDPAPVVFQTALSDWYPEYRLVCQAVPADPRPRALVLSALHANIQDVFNHYGVQIMSPQYFEDPPTPKVVPPEQWYPAPAVRPTDR